MTPQERAVHYEALYQKYQDQINQLQMIVDQHEEFLPMFKELSLSLIHISEPTRPY